MPSPSTRSSRRAEGLTTRSELTIHQNNALNRQILSNTSRRKRPRDSTDHDQNAISAKKARVTIEIDSRPKAQPKKRSLVIAPDAKSNVVLQRSAPKNSTTHLSCDKLEFPQNTLKRLPMVSNMSWIDFNRQKRLRRMRRGSCDHKRVRDSRASYPHIFRIMM